MPQALKRWLLRTVIALALLIGVPLLANLYGFYLVADFEDYLREHPVADATVTARLPDDAAPLTDGTRWIVGDRDPFAAATDDEGEGRITWTGRAVFRVVRGDTELAHAVIEGRATSPDGHTRDGFGLRVGEVRSADGLRAVVVAVLNDPDAVVGADSVAQGHLTAELLVVAGDGADQIHLLAGEHTTPLRRSALDFSSMLGLWLQLLFPVLSPPDEGFWLHLRSGIGFSAEQREDSSSSGSLDLTSFDSSTDLYSFEATVEQQFFDDPEQKFTSNSRVDIDRKLFGEMK